jgi:hypothetical protein
MKRLTSSDNIMDIINMSYGISTGSTDKKKETETTDNKEENDSTDEESEGVMCKYVPGKKAEGCLMCGS